MSPPGGHSKIQFLFIATEINVYVVRTENVDELAIAVTMQIFL